MSGAPLPVVRSCLATLVRVPPWSESAVVAQAFSFAESTSHLVRCHASRLSDASVSSERFVAGHPVP